MADNMNLFGIYTETVDERILRTERQGLRAGETGLVRMRWKLMVD